MMLVKKLFTFAIASLLLISCSKDDVKDYEGRWEGDFSGSRAGTWKIGIDEDGSVRGVLDINSEEKNIAVRGSVNKHGELTVTSSAAGREFVFNASLSDTDLNGNWSSTTNQEFSGSWKGEKKSSEWFPWHFLI
jgi:hypothetical protein